MFYVINSFVMYLEAIIYQNTVCYLNSGNTIVTLNFTKPMKRKAHPWEDRYCVLQVNAVECSQKNMNISAL